MLLDEQTADDYRALTAECGCVSLKEWSVVTLTGADRHTFLHNMCTNEIKGLSTGQHCEAFCTDVKGKIVAHVFVYLTDVKTLLVSVPHQAERLIAHLDRYIIREDVQLADETASCRVSLVAGGNAEQVLATSGLRTWFPLPVQTAFLCLDEGQHLPESATSCSPAAWDILRLEAGLPLYDVDFNAENLPQEIARDSQAINFNKGCYLGQETVARLDALGHVNKQLVSVKFPADSTPTAGIELSHEGKAVGVASSVAVSPKLGAPLGIAMIRRGANALGTQLDSPVGAVEIVSPPQA